MAASTAAPAISVALLQNGIMGRSPARDEIQRVAAERFYRLRAEHERPPPPPRP